MRPTLIVVSGPAGAGKTTLAHALAKRVGCPAVCRDEIKEGMVHAAPEEAKDVLTRRTLPVFFGVVEQLLRADVTTVAEAAFQDHVWRPGLERLRELARIRVVHCVVDAEVALARRVRRWHENPVRRAHEGVPVGHSEFERVSIAAPWMEVDTTDGYRPGLDSIAAFVNN